MVSVIMPVHNEKEYVIEAIKSVLSQSFRNFEFIIVDDGSNDGTGKIIDSYSRLDKRIKVIRNKLKMGVGYCINRAAKKSKGIYVARMDADDVMNKDRLAVQVDFMEKNPTVICSGSWMKEIDSEGFAIGKRTTPLNHKKIYETMYYAMAIQNPTLIINKKLIPADFQWCKTDGILDDLDLLFKLLEIGRFANIDRFLMKYRIHDGNLSLSNTKATFFEANLIRKNATRLYRYKPTLKGYILNLLETALVLLLPEKLIYPVYKLINNEKFL